MSSAVCTLTRKGFQWYRTGHPWVYRDDVAAFEGEDGDVVRVHYEKSCLGTAFLGRRSKIALRWIERGADPAAVDAELWRSRLDKAAARRAALARVTNAYRVVHDAADGIPGLVVDRYGEVGVLQSTIGGVERLLPLLTDILPSLIAVESLVLRGDIGVRKLEGLPQEVRVLRGQPPERVWLDETGPNGRIELAADPLGGQKTGAFLDQRENRWRTAELARGRMLDVFSYSGLFSLHAARRCTEVVAVDSSAQALELLAQSAQRNGLGNVRWERESAFDFLKSAVQRGERFDTVVADPPAFAKNRREVEAARRGYREINRRAMQLLGPGGILVTSSCSYNLDEAGFADVLREAAADARADFRVLERRGQAADHPVILCHPESAYLKCWILEKL